MGTSQSGHGRPSPVEVFEILAQRSTAGKGLDVALAVDFVRLALEGAYDVVATWVGCSRLRLPGSNLPWCHYLSEDDYRAVLDPTDYTLSR